MSLKKQYPESDGWITAKLTLKRGVSWTEDDARKYITLFGGNSSEIGHVDISRNPVVIIYREIKPAPELIEEHGTASLPSDH